RFPTTRSDGWGFKLSPSPKAGFRLWSSVPPHPDRHSIARYHWTEKANTDGITSAHTGQHERVVSACRRHRGEAFYSGGALVKPRSYDNSLHLSSPRLF